MELTGEYRLDHSRESVWQALNDPAILQKSIPGCQELHRKNDTQFLAVIEAKIGPVKAKFQGEVELSDIDAPHSYRISGEGKGGVAGFAKGSAKVELSQEETNITLLRYRAEGQVGGKLAQIGSRLIDGVAHKLAGEFFTAFAQELDKAFPPPKEASGEEIKTPVPQETLDVAAPPKNVKKQRSLNPVIWMTGLILLMGAILALFALG